jgi:hypothetical protein
LADRPFGPWAAEAWPRLADGVLAHGVGDTDYPDPGAELDPS